MANTNTELQKFNFHNHTLRVITDDHGAPWFIAMEVANILEYSDANKMTAKLDDDEVQNRQIGGFGNRGVNIINESGLYSAILTSKKPTAKLFKKWVTAEVLPSIRQTGGYQAPKVPYQQPPQLTVLLARAQQLQTRLYSCDQQRHAMEQALYRRHPLWQDTADKKRLGLTSQQIADSQNRHRRSVEKMASRMRKAGLDLAQYSVVPAQAGV